MCSVQTHPVSHVGKQETIQRFEKVERGRLKGRGRPSKWDRKEAEEGESGLKAALEQDASHPYCLYLETRQKLPLGCF